MFPYDYPVLDFDFVSIAILILFLRMAITFVYLMWVFLYRGRIAMPRICIGYPKHLATCMKRDLFE